MKDFKVGFNPWSTPNPDPGFVDQASFHSLTLNSFFYPVAEQLLSVGQMVIQIFALGET